MKTPDMPERQWLRRVIDDICEAYTEQIGDCELYLRASPIAARAQRLLNEVDSAHLQQWHPEIRAFLQQLSESK